MRLRDIPNGVWVTEPISKQPFLHIGGILIDRNGRHVTQGSWRDDYTPLPRPPEGISPIPFLTRAMEYSNKGSTGADPEIFVVDGSGTIIPAWEFLPKKTVAPPPQVFWDGFQAEFTILPRFCHAYLVDDFQRQLAAISGLAKKWNPSARLSPLSTIEVPFPIMDAAPADKIELGCAPSLNIYDGVRQLDIGAPRLVRIRTAGCHLHFDEIPHDEKVVGQVVRQIDMLTGVASVALLAGLEDARRRVYYGRAGEYRLPAHGLEYRTLSSSALCHPVVTHLLMDLARFGARTGAYGVPVYDISDASLQSIINELDVVAARKLLKTHKSTIMAVLMSIYIGGGHENAWRLLIEGADNLLECRNLEEVWYVGEVWHWHSANPNCQVATSVLKEKEV